MLFIATALSTFPMSVSHLQTAGEFEDVYVAYTQGVPYSGFEYKPFSYDAVWAVALTLHHVAQQLAAENSSIKIEDFDYDNTYLRERFMTALSDLIFEGMTVSTVLLDHRLFPWTKCLGYNYVYPHISGFT